jgi:mRNA deadenylase 3'-5' endonuclease subunit Ccr4
MGTIRIITYNLLSSKYSTKESFALNKAEHLDPEKRFKKISKQLISFISKKDTILSLQEVSIDWSARLKKIFEDNDYSFVCINYGTPESGFMGVGMAFPDNFKIVDKKTNKINHMLCWDDFEDANDDWTFIKNRNNHYISIKFEINDKSFWVVGVHMPCFYWKRNVMNHWCQLLSYSVEKDVQLDDIIIAGDFNHSDDSESSAVLKSGMNSFGSLGGNYPPNWPRRCNLPLFNVRYKNCSIHSLSLWGTKKLEETPPFRGKIDHIYFRGMKLLSVENPPHTDDLLPNEEHPSDHLPMGAIFSLSI